MANTRAIWQQGIYNYTTYQFPATEQEQEPYQKSLSLNKIWQSSGAVSRWPSWAPVPNKPTVCVDVKQHSTNVFGIKNRAQVRSRGRRGWTRHRSSSPNSWLSKLSTPHRSLPPAWSRIWLRNIARSAQGFTKLSTLIRPTLKYCPTYRLYTALLTTPIATNKLHSRHL